MRRRTSLIAAAAILTLAGAARAADAPERGVAHPALWPKAHSVGLVDPETEAFVTRLMAKMSLEEKVGQMIQADIGSIKPDDLRKYPLGSLLAGGNTGPLAGDNRSPAKAWLATTNAFRAVSLEARPGHTPIPVMFGIDAVHGENKVFGAVVFPHNIALGAAHDPDLMRRIGRATGEETAAVGIDWAFAPTLATPQDLRWGRTFEGYSQDPALVAQYAGAMVAGLQGDVAHGHVLQHGHVAATAKHFLGDGGTKGGVDQGDDDISEAELIRLHAQGYPPAIDAGVMTVMASYSSWKGRKMHGNETLLSGVLKGRMGFQGFVVSDWNGHGQVPGCSNTSCPKAIEAGVDMVMAPDGWKALFDTTVAQARSGQIPMARIDDAVRRILRVKVKLGLFDNDRPWAGRLQTLGSSEHREIAREAVRKSLVLLKNNGSVLPIRGSAHVLVAGSGADDIGRQSGGWTLTWQGDGNKNSDFPNGRSIWSGLKEAIEAQGGQAELAADGAFKAKPDVAVVVFGEKPYAEFQGDVRTLEYQPGDKSDLALLKRLKAQGVPVVAVFLSGRPLWTNPEINASDAFVAAWLPGTEGEGVADVLVGDAVGKPRADFQGRLSYAWPASADQAAQPPLFPLGYGLSYAQPAAVAMLSERAGVDASVSNVDTYFVAGKSTAPWGFALLHGGQRLWAGAGVSPAELDGVIALRPVDAAGIQEGGRRVDWTGKGEAALALTGPAINLDRQANGDVALELAYRLESGAPTSARLAVGAKGEALDLAPELAQARVGEWRTVKVQLKCFRAAGADLSQVSEPFVLTASGPLSLTLRAARLNADPSGARCLPQAPGHG